MKKICEWNESKHGGESCPLHSVRLNDNGEPEETFDGGVKWIDLPLEDYEEMKDSDEFKSQKLSDLDIEMETEDYDSGKDGHHDYSTTITINGKPVVILSEMNEDKAIKELTKYLNEKLNFNVSEKDLKDSFI